jgi:glutaredoxin
LFEDKARFVREMNVFLHREHTTFPFIFDQSGTFVGGYDDLMKKVEDDTHVTEIENFIAAKSVTNK